ncbi:hypothetical protein PINS_up004642 [Pythium insidiosum]|nr:hypothetical protein PINS_up004642 [Pythium insidiosum]
MPFPDGIDDDMYALMCEYDAWLWHTLYNRRAFCRSAFREGVRELHRHLQRVLQSLTTPSATTIDMSFFSAHDNSIVALVSAAATRRRAHSCPSTAPCWRWSSTRTPRSAIVLRTRALPGRTRRLCADATRAGKQVRG